MFSAYKIYLKYCVPIGLYEANLPTNTNVNKYTVFCYCEGRLSLKLTDNLGLVSIKCENSYWAYITVPGK